MKKYNNAFCYAALELRADKEVSAAIKKDYGALRFAAKELISLDKEVVLENPKKKDNDAFRFAAKELRAR